MPILAEKFPVKGNLISGRPQERTLSHWGDFQGAWNGVLNFRMTGDCVPFNFELPSIDEIVREVRDDPDVLISAGIKSDRADVTSDIRDAFRRLSIEEAVMAPCQITHYKLSNFYGAGQVFHGFEEQVMEPWRQALAAAGFTWTRCYPILFISGPGCATNYHMDFSHVVAWQRYGTKKFVGYRDPHHWAPLPVRVGYVAGQLAEPPEITEDDELAYIMEPGDVVWNCLLTPHRVEAADEMACSINLSHGGLRLHGELAPHEQELEAWRQSQSA